MATEIHLAVAGSGKTTEIINRINAQDEGVSSLAVTFTRNAQAEIQSRLTIASGYQHETIGWFSFLSDHIVRPYLPAVFPGVIPRGLNFVASAGLIHRSRAGWKYYFDDEQRPYSVRLSVLAKKVLVETNYAPIRRLESIFDRIYIDEFQDLVGNDLVVLQALMESSIDILMTGDVRQAVLQTSQSDRLFADYRGVEIVSWFRSQETEQRCTIIPQATTKRFNQQIADFSDMIHAPELALPSTTSSMYDSTGHDGVFLLDEDEVNTYMNSFDQRPTQLWYRSSDRITPPGELLTFGSAKGITRDRVIIYATTPIVQLLKSRKPLAAKSACGFYVAVTRARFSVALVVASAKSVYSQVDPLFAEKISLWESDPN
ncbi:MAG: AAA family ATPase [Thermomicrobiales bacterium]|nr:AAA family ATPase [Thermomicrobiales bacterium]MCO5228056.1 AAA family ATPase [Thermomicrobiales bacterium]